MVSLPIFHGQASHTQVITDFEGVSSDLPGQACHTQVITEYDGVSA